MARTYDWEAVEAEYRTGRFSLRQLADRHGPSEGAIRKRAKAKGWQKDLTDAVIKRTREKITRASLPPEAREMLTDDDKIVEYAATENSAVVHGHRKMLARWRGLVDHYSSQLAGQVETGRIEVKTKSGDIAKVDVDLDYVGRCMSHGTNALERVVKLERQSFGLDLEGDDTPPERELTDEELEAKIRKLQGADG